MFDRSEFLATLAGATGGEMAIAIMEAFSASTGFPLVAIPFATSIVTVLGSPKAPPAQPLAATSFPRSSACSSSSFADLRRGPRHWQSVSQWP